MSKFLAVFKREYAQIVKKRSFLIMTLVLPALMGGFIMLPALLASKAPSEAESISIVDRDTLGVGDEFAGALDGFFLDEEDSSPAYRVNGVINLNRDDSARYASVFDSLSSMVKAEDLKYVLVVQPDAHVMDDGLLLITNAENFRTERRFESSLSQILSKRRLAASDINLPVDSIMSLTRSADLHKQDTTGEAIPFMVKYFGALIFVMILYGMIIGYGAMLMRSIIDEKNSRIVEVLISSATPTQLMFGKVLGLGAAALTQVAIWLTVGGALYMGGISTMQIDSAVARLVFNPVIVVFFVLFFIGGYMLYSSLFALVGSILNSEKESQAFVMPISLCLIMPVMIGIAVIQNPYALWVQVLAYIPIFSPSLMLMRVLFVAPTATDYSLFSGIVGEASLAFLVVMAFTALVVWLSARIFRVGILMYGKRPTLPEIIKWVKRA